MNSREEFEESARLDHDFGDDDFRIMSNGGYYWGPTQMIWETWQSARQRESDLFDLVSHLLEALQNLENDNGKIPDHAWKLVQDAIAKATTIQ